MTTQSYSSKTAPYFAGIRPEMLAFVPAQAKRVLEIGCGSGEFGAALKQEFGAEVTGVELFPEAAETARTRLDRVIVADVERDALDLPPGHFDCLVCNDVLEHLVDPWTVLRNLRSYVQENGTLVVSIPNVRHHKVVRHLVWPGEWRYEKSGVLDRTHLRFFTRKTACEMVESAGFRIERVEGINRSSFPVWLRLANWITRGGFEDMRYLQFAIVARND